MVEITLSCTIIRLLLSTCFICLSAVFLANAYQNLSIKELILKCTKPSGEWEKVWQEFRNRFDEYILLYINKEFNRSCGYKNRLEVYETIKDLRQDVYIKLLSKEGRALKNFKGTSTSSFQAYLHTISVNIVRNYLKSRLNRENHLSASSRLKNDLTVESASQEPFNTDSTDKTDAEFFKEFIIDTLRKKYHSRKIERDILVFKLFYFDGFSSKELYDKYDFDLSSSGIETLVSRMKAVLKDIEA